MSRRLNLTIDEATHQALVAAASLRGTRPTTLAGSIITSAVTDQVPHNDAHPEPATYPDATTPRERAMWLQLDRGSEWRRSLWDAANLLRDSYAELSDVLRDGWHTDRFTRDGILALTVWRNQLDQGDHTDPRLELQWLTALRDFKRLDDDHRRQVTIRSGAPARPDDW